MPYRSSKVCSKCGTLKPLSEFYKNKSRHRGIKSECKKCANEYHSRHNHTPSGRAINKRYRNSIKGRLVSRRMKLKAYYGITIEEYDRMLEKQNNCCAICKTNTPSGKYGRFHVDHCHKTNKIRGILCDSCNRMLGFAKDSINVLLNAIKYLGEQDGSLR